MLELVVGKREKAIHTGMRSAYFWRMRSASALRFSKGCSSLNLDRMVGGSGGEMCVCGRERCICSGRVRSCCVDVDVDVVL